MFFSFLFPLNSSRRVGFSGTYFSPSGLRLQLSRIALLPVIRYRYYYYLYLSLKYRGVLFGERRARVVYRFRGRGVGGGGDDGGNERRLLAAPNVASRPPASPWTMMIMRVRRR